MNDLLLVAPWMSFVGGAVVLMKALGQYQTFAASNARGRRRALILAIMAAPPFAHAAVDLQSSVEAGNAIIMYLCGIIAAVGIVAAGVAMMMGRQAIAKWAFAGAMISGLGFAIVKTMWSNFGLTPADVSTFAP